MVVVVTTGLVVVVVVGLDVGGGEVDDVVGSDVVGGGSVVVAVGGDVVFTGGEVVTTGRRVVTTAGDVVANPTEAATVLVVDSTVDDAVVDEVSVVGTTALVTGGRVVVVDGAWVASWRLGEVSLPANTSTRRAMRASEASA